MGLWGDSASLMRTWVGVIAPAAFAFCGCAQNAKGRIYLIDEFRSVSGNLIVKNGFDPTNAEFSLIDSSGYRTTPNQFEFDPTTKNFSFNLEDEHFYETKMGTLIERMLSMGNALPIVGFLDSNSFGRVEKYVKFEIRPLKFSNEKIQKVPYLQFAIPLSKSNLYSSNNDLNFGSALEIGEAVFAQVKVVDSSGAPIEGADATAISYSKIEEGSVPYWHQENYRPVFTKTDANGLAYVGPIVPNELQAFHLLVKGNELCTFVSASNYKFSSEYEVPALLTSKCDTAAAANQFSLQPSFPTGLKYFDLKSDSFENPVVHTNEANIYIRLDSATPNLRGFKVELFETDSKYVAYPEPELTREYPFFQSEVVLDLPKIFKKSQDEAGKFMIKITEQSGKVSGFVADSQQPSEAFIYGEKRLVKPSREDLMAVEIVANDYVWDNNGTKPDSIDYWKNVKIVSEAGVENIVSGLAGKKFTISSDSCREGYELGFEVITLGISKRFAPCVDGVASFSAESAGFLSAAANIQLSGGRQVWRLYMKDRYGNESDALSGTVDPDKKLNIVTVIIDTGLPALGDGFHTLANLEFVESGTAQSIIYKNKVISGDVSFRFDQSGPTTERICSQASTDADQDKSNGKNGSTATIKNGENDFAFYLFRDELARIVARNDNYELAGQMFVKYFLAATQAAVEAASVGQFTKCRVLSDPDNIEDIVAAATVLTEDHIKFPSDTTAPAEFYLRVQDSAGNLSEVVKYEVPVCDDPNGTPTPPSGASKCWAPPPPTP